MRIGLTLYSTGYWLDILAAAQACDAGGIDAIGLGDRYHSEPGDPFFTGLSVYGAFAVATRRVHLVPMVFSQLNYPVGRLAKETSVLSIMSGGRFEMGIGAGDYPREPEAWGNHTLTPSVGSRRYGKPLKSCGRYGQGRRSPLTVATSRSRGPVVIRRLRTFPV